MSNQTDVRAQAVLAGHQPIEDLDGSGLEDQARWGRLTTAGGSRRKVPSKRGAYPDFYTQFAAAARGSADQAVPAREAVATLEVLDGARTSATDARVALLGTCRRAM